MEKEYDNTNRGVAFENDKAQSENSPQWRGSGNYDGVDFEFGIWEKTSASGKSYLSFSFKEPYKKEAIPNSGYEKAKAQAEKLKNKEIVQDANDMFPSEEY